MLHVGSWIQCCIVWNECTSEGEIKHSEIAHKVLSCFAQAEMAENSKSRQFEELLLIDDIQNA